MAKKAGGSPPQPGGGMMGSAAPQSNYSGSTSATSPPQPSGGQLQGAASLGSGTQSAPTPGGLTDPSGGNFLGGQSQSAPQTGGALGQMQSAGAPDGGVRQDVEKAMAQHSGLPQGFDPNDPANAEIMQLRQQNMAARTPQAQPQGPSTPFFNGPAYSTEAAAKGGRSALTHRNDGTGNSQIGYYGDGKWNSLGAMPHQASPEFQQFHQQASWEGDQEQEYMAKNAAAHGVPSSYSPTYTAAAPPSWAKEAQDQRMMASALRGGGAAAAPQQGQMDMFMPQTMGGLGQGQAQPRPFFSQGDQQYLSPNAFRSRR